MSLNPSDKTIAFVIKPILFTVCLVPFIALVIGAVNNTLGTNPVETMTHETGEWTLRFLLLTLMITPLRRLSGKSWLIKLRRMLGLYAFFYACLHFITYIWFDQYFDWMEIVRDIPKRPFITVGFTAFVLLIPLAVTSNNKMMRRLKKNWVKLHKLVYVIAVLGVLHFLWLVKADTLEPLIYASILLLLLGYRAYYQRKKVI
jgi:sulfoxide reductase heme-binding subunit YedZ